ncbi:MAG TPA: hypothetical protein VFQ39_13020 [Longimicrobium sp.]|nr:hypothetical protein [Longimicrobium sp.]
MKKSTAIRLTLVSTLAVGASACADRGPEQQVREWCDPDDPAMCSREPRAGFVPIFVPIYHGGYYYDQRGVARTAPNGPVARNAPRSSVSRGGFGRTGSSRGIGA